MCITLNKSGLFFVYGKIMLLFPSFLAFIILESCDCKKQIFDVNFLCIDPLTGDKLHHNTVKVYCRTTLQMAQEGHLAAPTRFHLIGDHPSALTKEQRTETMNPSS